MKKKNDYGQLLENSGPSVFITRFFDTPFQKQEGNRMSQQPLAATQSTLLAHQTSSFSFWSKHSQSSDNPSPSLPPNNQSTNHPQPLVASTVKLLPTYRQCHPDFKYSSKLNPKRILTKPSEAAHNNGWDNENHDYILHVNEVLGEKPGQQYFFIQ